MNDPGQLPFADQAKTVINSESDKIKVQKTVLKIDQIQ